jgi:hypothetical protein
VDQDIALPDCHLLEPLLRLFENHFSAVARLKIAYRSMATRFLRERNPGARLACLQPMSDRAPDLRQGIGHSSLRVYCRAEAEV